MAVLIFMCELLFIYSSDWLGYTWGIGDGLFNANVAYFGKPISTGMTPVGFFFQSEDVSSSFIYCSRQKYEMLAYFAVKVREMFQVINVYHDNGNLSFRISSFSITCQFYAHKEDHRSEILAIFFI